MSLALIYAHVAMSILRNVHVPCQFILTICRMSLGSMSPVEVKKCPGRCSDFRGLPP